jgi:hypothetical protein
MSEPHLNRTDAARRAVLIRALRVAVALVGAAAAPAIRAAPANPGPPRLAVVASNLNNPRKLFLSPSGVLYITEAGLGGHDKCLPPLSQPICVGMTGSITRVLKGVQTRVVTGLVSVAGLTHQRAEGPAAVLVHHGTYDVLLQDTLIDKRGLNALGPDGRTAGDLVSTRPGKGTTTVVANLAAYEAVHNPDHGAGRGARFGDPPIDSDPYAITAYRGGFAVADAAANDLLWISPKGAITVLAVFPTQTERLSAKVAREIGAPAGMSSIVVQSVPMSVAEGPDGALYVGELTGIPFAPGTARIWRVVPARRPAVYATGFTNISDLAFAGKNLLVLEIAAQGLLHPRSPGALIRLSPDGRRTVIASTGLVAPTGLAVGRRSIYISNYGLFPGTGPGPHGQVVRLSS